tara:strand:- start:25 stop:387 length:363 start_codon:yes stop_codon:yes gene_type:complete
MNDLIKQYKSAKKGRRDSRIVGTPLPSKPKLNQKDFNRGYIVRHFVQKVNDDFSPITEVSQSGLNKIKTNPLYRSVSLRWRLTGTNEQIKNSNRASLSEKLKIIPQLKNRLVNLIEYSKK